MNFFNVSSLNNNFPSMNPAFPGIYEQQYKDSCTSYVNNLNSITNNDEYKKDIVEIIFKLQKMKGQ